MKRLSLLIATLIGLLAPLLAAVPAQAADLPYPDFTDAELENAYDHPWFGWGNTQPEPPRFGEREVYEPYHYLQNSGVRIAPEDVLFVDTTRDSDGFWYARKIIGERGFLWRFQPYKTWCGSDDSELTWVGQQNVWLCLPRPDSVRGQLAAWCQAASGQEWKQVALYSVFINGGNSGPTQRIWSCTDADFSISGDMMFMQTARPHTEQPRGVVCAPWEPQGLTKQGRPACESVTYPWVNNPHGYWSPQPDECFANRPVYRDGIEAYWSWHSLDTRQIPAVPAIETIPVPAPIPLDCDGFDPAPNCEPAVAHLRACSNEPTPKPSDPAGVTVEATHQATESFEASITHSATATANRGSASASFTRTVKPRTVKLPGGATRTFAGKTFTRKATAPQQVSVTKKVTVTKTATDTARATLTCTRPVREDAQTCARQRAKNAATEAALDGAKEQATKAARAAAVAQATTQAEQAAKTAPVTPQVRQAAQAQARQLAKADATRRAKTFRLKTRRKIVKARTKARIKILRTRRKAVTAPTRKAKLKQRIANQKQKRAKKVASINTKIKAL